jgi:hypothetical protein
MNKNETSLRLGLSWVLVTHACNPSYLGGRDQEVHSWKLVQASSS